MSSSITIGSFTLDDSYAPLVNLSFEYFRTEGQEIIGGLQKYSISGTVSVGDAAGGSTGATVMTKLKSIRDLGKQTSCINVIIPNFYTGKARIANVNIEQGSDPTWINQGSFTIELEAPLLSIPKNSLGILASDNVSSVSVNESLELGEESHNSYIIDNGLILSKQFIKFKNSIELTCKPLCSNTANTNGIINILSRLIKIGPSNSIFETYKTWKPYSQSRKLEITTEGSVSFTSDIILVPPDITDPVFIDIEYEHSNNYESKEENKKIIGTITGLASVNWSDIISLSDTSSASKFSNASSVFNKIKSKYVNETNWTGIGLDLLLKPNCPSTKTGIGRCGSGSEDEPIRCFLPMSSTITGSRTEGVINFTFEWSTQEFNKCGDNGFKTDITVDISEQASLVEHVIPNIGTLIQNLNCNTPRKYTFTLSVTTPNDICSTIPSTCVTNAETKFYDTIRSRGITPGGNVNWILTENIITTTLNSSTVKQTYIYRPCLL